MDHFADCPDAPWLRPSLRSYVPAAADQFLARLETQGAAVDVRDYKDQAPRHARHLAALWGVPLHHAGRATLLMADTRSALVLVPADRKISAVRVRPLLHAADLRVLRGDRGVGRLGWSGMPGTPGALPALPAAFSAESWVDQEIMELPELVVALDATRSARLLPAAYAAAYQSTIAALIGRTRLHG